MSSQNNVVTAGREAFFKEVVEVADKLKEWGECGVAAGVVLGVLDYRGGMHSIVGGAACDDVSRTVHLTLTQIIDLARQRIEPVQVAVARIEAEMGYACDPHAHDSVVLFEAS